MKQYTLLEAAEALNVSKSTIKGRLHRLPEGTAVKGTDGKILIPEDALPLLQSSRRSEPAHEPESEPVTSQDQTGEPAPGTKDATKEAMQQTIDILKEQLAIKDRQIEDLSAALRSSQEVIRASQALHAGTIQQALNESEETEKAPEPQHRSLWQRFKDLW